VLSPQVGAFPPCGPGVLTSGDRGAEPLETGMGNPLEMAVLMPGCSPL